jgi:hypothetical protein
MQTAYDQPFAVARFLGHQLYGMNPYNPVVTFLAVAALALAALFASAIPAFRQASFRRSKLCAPSDCRAR